MKPFRSLLTGLLGILALALPAVAAQLGDPAAPLQIAEWVKGKPVDLAAEKGKKIFVVEFWATWCGPCRASIPHLTELQKKFKDKDVVFIGVSDEEVGPVKKFVTKMADKMDYTVVVDKDGNTSKGYMTAYGQDGIPHAFIVDKQGRIVWHGHPMGDLEKSLAQVVADTYDIQKAKKREAAEKKMFTDYYVAACGEAGANTLDELGKKLLDANTKNASTLNEWAWTILTDEQIKTRDLKLATKLAKAAVDASESKDAGILDTYARALFDSGKVSEALTLQKRAIELAADNDELRQELEKTLKGYQAKLAKK